MDRNMVNIDQHIIELKSYINDNQFNWQSKKQELEILKSKTIEEIWLEELKELSTHYAIYIRNRIKRASGKIDKIKVKRVKAKKLT